MKPELNQFWKDTINGDLLKILGFAHNEENGKVYVRCACFVSGKEYLGVQEMRTEHLEGNRFRLVKPWFWQRWKLNRQLNQSKAAAPGLEKKNY